MISWIKKYTCVVIASIAFADIFSSIPVYGEETFTPESALARYKAGLVELDEAFKHCHGEATETALVFRNGVLKPFSSSRFTFAFSGSSGLLLETLDPPVDPSPRPVSKNQPRVRSYQRVLAFNSTYSMGLAKKSPESSFLIRWLENGSAAAEKLISRGLGKVVRCSMTTEGLPVSQLVELTGFRLEKLTPLDEPGQPHRLRFDFLVPLKPNLKAGSSQVTSGWLIVAPGYRWVLMEYGFVRTAWDGAKTTQVGIIQQDLMKTPIPTPISIRYRNYSAGLTENPGDTAQQLLSQEEVRFTNFSFGDQPESVFRLAGYGLPEFGQTVARAAASRSYPWWIAGTSIALIVLALALRWVASRSARQSDPAKPLA